MAKNYISSFTSSGKSVTGVGRSGVPLATPGVRQADGTVYLPARKTLSGGVEGSSVKITNSKAAPGTLARRTVSLGMGGVAQRGRHQDF